RRVHSTDQCSGRGERWHVVPEALEAFALADGIVTPGPGAVVEALRVVEYAAPQRLPVAMRSGGHRRVHHRVEVCKDALTLHQRDGALLRVGHVDVALRGGRGD